MRCKFMMPPARPASLVLATLLLPALAAAGLPDSRVNLIQPGS
jgi:hypothetical protein